MYNVLLYASKRQAGIYVCVYIYNLYVFFIASDSPSPASWLYFLGGKVAVESELAHRDLFVILGTDTHDC